jgi:hypothetical protein
MADCSRASKDCLSSRSSLPSSNTRTFERACFELHLLRPGRELFWGQLIAPAWPNEALVFLGLLWQGKFISNLGISVLNIRSQSRDGRTRSYCGFEQTWYNLMESLGQTTRISMDRTSAELASNSAEVLRRFRIHELFWKTLPPIFFSSLHPLYCRSARSRSII